MGAVLATRGRGAESGEAPPDTLPGSAEVARVTAPNAPVDREHPGPGATVNDPSGKDNGEATGSGKDDQHHAASDDPSVDDDGGADGVVAGIGGGGSGGEEPKPLATVNLPVVGTVTVEEPDLPLAPDAGAPDLSDVPLPDLPEVKLP